MPRLRETNRKPELVAAFLTPKAVEASLRASEHLTQENKERYQTLMRKCEQLDYKAQRAFEQYDKVDPANRLVADSLEKRWNEKLKALEYTRNELTHEDTQAKQITDQDKSRIVMLGMIRAAQ